MSVEIKNLTVTIAGKNILENINFKTSGVGVSIIRGDNGAGKTTFLNLLAGVIKQKKGSYINTYAKTLMTFQTPCILQRSALENVIHTAKYLKVKNYREKSINALQEMGLEHCTFRAAKNLSGGEKMRLQMARLMASNAKLWLLDEPYAGLDRPSLMRLDNIILRAAENTRVLISSHNYAIAKKLKTNTYIIENKTIFNGDEK